MPNGRPAAAPRLDLPGALVDAQARGRLVLFCGAGVSAPSGVPAFAELVEEICGSLAEPVARRELAEPAAVLDRLCARGHPVRELVAAHVRERACDVGWHLPLLRLAAPPADGAQPRIVTTNYDTLFERAAERLARRVRRWVAPKLPTLRRGAPWPGLVYLHGRLDTSPDNRDLVLTTADLLRAYRRERWAATFCDGVLSEHEILLVGHSPTEAVAEHLASRVGEQDGTRLWALCRDGDRERWERLGVTPVVRASYPAIRDTLIAWAEAAAAVPTAEVSRPEA